MLSPDYLEQAGDKVASVYSQIESDMLDYLVAAMIKGDISGQRAQTALNSLAQSSASELMEIIGRYERDIDAAVKVEVGDALRRSDADDLERIKAGLGVVLPSIATRQIAATVAGVKEMLSRQNLLMAESARNAFLQQSIWAVTQVNAGAMTAEQALHGAVRRLERAGIDTITYRNSKTGVQTVQSKIDVAVRRHVRTQIAQGGMRLTEQRLDAAGVDLVEVSSHVGSRPSHAAWEGRVYARHGSKTIGGVHYQDFHAACNYGDVSTGIGGANCRHSYAAWFPGMQRAYHPNPKHPSGKTNAEVYELTQKQRAGERAIRQTKRELRGAQQLYKATGSAESLGDASKLKIKLKNQQGAVRKLVGDNPKVLQRSPRREWAGDMPRVKVASRSTRRPPKKQTAWRNPAIEKLRSGEEVASFLSSRHDIEVAGGFADTGVEFQRSVAAGIDAAAAKYGKGAAKHLRLIEGRTADDGRFSTFPPSISIRKGAPDPYIVAFHEQVHAIDAEKSSEMDKFVQASVGEAYNLYSEKVLDDALKSLGVRKGSKKYKDMILSVFDYDFDLMKRYGKSPYEIIAYALDREERAKSSELSRAIKERF